MLHDERVESDVAFFRPSVDGQMRFRQHHHAGYTAAIAELVETFAYRNQPRFRHQARNAATSRNSPSAWRLAIKCRPSMARWNSP